jgi:gluconolactonase
MEQPVAGVYRIDPSGAVRLMIGCLDKPNGLAFSPDERTLYVSDTGHSHRPGGNRHIFRFDIAADGTVGPLTVFREIVPAACDGLRISAGGTVWSTAGDGVHLYGSDGALRGRIDLAEMATNLCFLPPPGRRIFVTTPTRALVCDLSRHWDGQA